MRPRIRRATTEDIPFLSWVMFTAARSHLDTCVWETIFDEAEAGVRDLLERVARTAQTHWCHGSKFWIAEVEGTPAAALCGFVPESEGSGPLGEAMLDVARNQLSYPEERINEILQRGAVSMGGMPDDLEEVWGVENVAVLPEYRGAGLTDRLFEHVLEEGRSMGFSRAQILCLIGNEPAQRAWERNGFQLRTERRNEAFEALFGCPGGKLFAQDL
jgi:GNAT superfamily N-acetyltransferase